MGLAAPALTQAHVRSWMPFSAASSPLSARALFAAVYALPSYSSKAVLRSRLYSPFCFLWKTAECDLVPHLIDLCLEKRKGMQSWAQSAQGYRGTGQEVLLLHCCLKGCCEYCCNQGTHPPQVAVPHIWMLPSVTALGRMSGRGGLTLCEVTTCFSSRRLITFSNAYFCVMKKRLSSWGWTNTVS